MPRLIGLGCVLVFLAAASADGAAQPLAEPVLLRLDSNAATPGLDRFVARNATATIFNKENYPTLSLTTPRDLITRQCGSLRGPYIAEFERANNGALPNLDAQLGERSSVIVPACFYLSVSREGLTVPVASIGSPHLAFEAYTGASGNDGQVAAFFNMSVEAIRLWRSVSLRARYATAPVALTPVGMSRDDFVASVQAIARSEQTTGVHVVEGTPPAHIIGATAADADATCIPGTSPPFDAIEVHRAYQTYFSVSHANPYPTSIAVVDNGFFGADVHNDFSGSPFPSEYFARGSDGRLALKLELHPTSYPINYANGISPDAVSGHGTHVTGIVLGGPAFVTFRDVYASGAAPWISVSILNVGRGTRYMLDSAQAQLQSKLNLSQNFAIVNMSIAYEGPQSLDLYADFARLFRDAPSSLFVVAAGNGHHDISSNFSVYPAALGGPNAPNVMTVAATEGAHQLASLSNFGALAIDISAPGCGIPSWLANTPQTTLQNGTSSAAPFVTFAASLLRSTNSQFDGGGLKSRLILSGDMLPNPLDRQRTAYGVELNVRKALYWWDDLIRLRSDPQTYLLGRVQDLRGLQCAPGQSVGLSHLRAFKRSPDAALVFRGQPGALASQPCAAILASGASIRFVESSAAHLGQALAPEAQTRTIRFDDIEEIVMRAPIGPD